MQKGQIEAELAKSMDKRFWSDLQDRLNSVKENAVEYKLQKPELAWNKMRKSTPADFLESPETAISKDTIVTIVKGLISHPEGFNPLKKVEKMLENRRIDMRKKSNVDWAAAELLAYEFNLT